MFGVTPGAIAMWEKGQREISGSALILLQQLEHDFGLTDAQAMDRSLESHHLSEFFAAKILKASEKDRNSFKKATAEMLETHLSSTEGTRRLQVSLLEKVVDTLADAKGLPLKIIQMASFMDFGLSHESRATLAKIQNTLSPMSTRSLNETFQQEFGRPPERVFAHWNPRPVAAASIGQVHQAILESGEKVAVKIQYPNIYRKMVIQTRAIQLISTLMALFRNDYSDMLSDFVAKLRAECDYRNEMKTLEEFHEIYKDDPQIKTPKVFKDYSNSRILTMEYIEGQNFHSFIRDADQSQKNLAGGIIHRFNYESTMKHGLIQTDLHPGNYIFLSNRVAFLDFGRVVRPSADELQKMKDFFRAVHANEPDAALQAMKISGHVREWNNFSFEEFWNVLRSQIHYELSETPVKFSRDYVRGIWRSANSFKQRRNLTVNAHFFWPVFTSAALWSILGDLEAEYLWRENAVRNVQIP